MLILYGMIKTVQPKNIIEIGSGFSSAVMLNTNEYCFDNKIELSFIEPYPQRLRKILNIQFLGLKRAGYGMKVI